MTFPTMCRKIVQHEERVPHCWFFFQSVPIRIVFLCLLGSIVILVEVSCDSSVSMLLLFLCLLPLHPCRVTRTPRDSSSLCVRFNLQKSVAFICLRFDSRAEPRYRGLASFLSCSASQRFEKECCHCWTSHGLLMHARLHATVRDVQLPTRSTVRFSRRRTRRESPLEFLSVG